MLVFAAAAIAQFRTGVTLVRVDTQVTDRAGHVVTDLTQSDFQVFDSGTLQHLTSFEHSQSPLDLLLLLDASGSMRPVMRDLAAEAQSALSALHEGDRAGVMVFASNARVALELTTEVSRAADAIASRVDASLGGGTHVNASILAAVGYLALQPERGRRAILIVTDNQGLNAKLPDELVIRRLFESDTVLNAIIVGKNKRLPALPPGSYINPDYTEVDVTKIAAATGGETLQPHHAADALGEMINRIRARYTLTYPAPGGEPGGFHRIEVRIPSRPDLAVHARQGYYAE